MSSAPAHVPSKECGTMSTFVLVTLLVSLHRKLHSASIQRIDSHLLAIRGDENQMMRYHKVLHQLVVPLVGSVTAHVECARSTEAVLLMFAVTLSQWVLLEASSSDTLLKSLDTTQHNTSAVQCVGLGPCQLIGLHTSACSESPFEHGRS